MDRKFQRVALVPSGEAWLSGSDRKERAGRLPQDLLRCAPAKRIEKPLVTSSWHGNHLHLLLARNTQNGFDARSF